MHFWLYSYYKFIQYILFYSSQMKIFKKIRKLLTACFTLWSGLLACTLFDSYLFFFFPLIIKFEMRQRLAECLFLFCEIVFWCKGKMLFRRERKREKNRSSEVIGFSTAEPDCAKTFFKETVKTTNLIYS